MNFKLYLRLTPILVCITFFSGCKMLEQKKEWFIHDMPAYSSTYKVNASVSDKSIRNAIFSSLSYPKGAHQETFKNKSTNNNVHNPGTTFVYEVKGWKTDITNKKDVIEIIYEVGDKFVDSRDTDGYYSLTGHSRIAYVDIAINTTKGIKTILVSTQKHYERLHREPLFGSLKEGYEPIPELVFLQQIEKKIKNIRMSFPTKKAYSGTLTLKNDDVTSYANIQRNFSSSLLSTNDKTDSEKSGAFLINNRQKVTFKLYPYKGVSKVKYSFNYKYSFNDQGSSNFDKNYSNQIIESIKKEFNR